MRGKTDSTIGEILTVKPSIRKPAVSVTAQIAEQLRRAFEGSAWHGPSMLELLEDVDAETAAARPIPNVHSIWELVLHTAVWDRAVRRRIGGQTTQPKGKKNFPPVPKSSSAGRQAAWRKTVSLLTRTHADLIRAVSALPEERLRDHVPGKRYDISFMLHGVLQHELYHAGQIAILKKAHRRAAQ
jgi:uncharacterized damage-inducible protein DinB